MDEAATSPKHILENLRMPVQSESSWSTQMGVILNKFVALEVKMAR